MGFLIDHPRAIATYLTDRARYGLAEVEGPLDNEVLFMLDGVGGSQLAPLAVRRVLRTEDPAVGSVLFRWQTPVPCEIWTDLMWLRRNRLKGIALARKILAFRRARPQVALHLIAFSGGVGITLFACEHLRGRGQVQTLIIACPAVSPDYNLSRALRSVRRCYALVSHRDRLILGAGTRVFGTTDRRFQPGAGLVGFRMPSPLNAADTEAYGRLGVIRWTPKLKDLGHYGGHMGWTRVPFLRAHLLPLMRGEPELPVEPAIGA